MLAPLAVQEFPDVEQLYKHRTLYRLIEREQWSVAATFVEGNPQWQV